LNTLNFTQGLLPLEPITDITVEERKDPYIEVFDVELPLPEGNNRELDQYISIQDEFPKTYKTGREGIADSETDLRKAQRLQFKAYLLFFDQLLADYLAQLNAAKDILSWRNEMDKTYFVKNLNDDEIADFTEIFNSDHGYDKYSKIVEPESVRRDRRNRFLNHLMARFNEEFIDYSLILFQKPEKNSDCGEPLSREEEQIAKKKDFLRNFASLSRDRSRAIDYAEPFRGEENPNLCYRTKNVSGLEEALHSRLGVDDARV